MFRFKRETDGGGFLVSRGISLQLHPLATERKSFLS